MKFDFNRIVNLLNSVSDNDIEKIIDCIVSYNQEILLDDGTQVFLINNGIVDNLIEILKNLENDTIAKFCEFTQISTNSRINLLNLDSTDFPNLPSSTPNKTRRIIPVDIETPLEYTIKHQSEIIGANTNIQNYFVFNQGLISVEKLGIRIVRILLVVSSSSYYGINRLWLFCRAVLLLSYSFGHYSTLFNFISFEILDKLQKYFYCLEKSFLLKVYECTFTLSSCERKLKKTIFNILNSEDYNNFISEPCIQKTLYLLGSSCSYPSMDDSLGFYIKDDPKLFDNHSTFCSFAKHRDSYINLWKFYSESTHDDYFYETFFNKSKTLVNSCYQSNTIKNLARLFVHHLRELVTFYHYPNYLNSFCSSNKTFSDYSLTKPHNKDFSSKLKRLQLRLLKPTENYNEIFFKKLGLIPSDQLQFFQNFIKLTDSYSFNLNVVQQIENFLTEIYNDEYINQLINTFYEKNDDSNKRFYLISMELKTLAFIYGYIVFIQQINIFNISSGDQLTSFQQSHNMLFDSINWIFFSKSAVHKGFIILFIPFICIFFVAIFHNNKKMEECIAKICSKAFYTCINFFISSKFIKIVASLPAHNSAYIESYLFWVINLVHSDDPTYEEIFGTYFDDLLYNQNRLDALNIINSKYLYECSPLIASCLDHLNGNKEQKISLSNHRKIILPTHQNITFEDHSLIYKNSQHETLRQNMINIFLKMQSQQIIITLEFLKNRLFSNFKKVIINNQMTNLCEHCFQNIQNRINNKNLHQSTKYSTLKIEYLTIFTDELNDGLKQLRYCIISYTENFLYQKCFHAVDVIFDDLINTKVRYVFSKILHYDITKSIDEWMKVKVPNLFENQLEKKHHKNLNKILNSYDQDDDTDESINYNDDKKGSFAK